jgi:hypothetical protein
MYPVSSRWLAHRRHQCSELKKPYQFSSDTHIRPWSYRASLDYLGG